MNVAVKELTPKIIAELNQTIIVLDTETTGFSKYSDRVIEFGAIKLINGCVVDAMSQLINPQFNIPKSSIEIHGITDEMVRNKPCEKEVVPKIVDFIKDSSYLVGHNVIFDIGFLEEMFKRNGYILNCQYIDTLKLAKKIYKQANSYKLVELAKYLNIEIKGAHRALADVEITVELLRYLCYDSLRSYR